MYCKIYPSINLYFCRDICVGENDGVREHDDSEVQLGEAEEGGTIGWCHTHTSCASLLKRTTNWKNVSLHLFRTFAGKVESHCFWFSFFPRSRPIAWKGCECKWGERCEHNNFKKNYFSAKNFKIWVKKMKVGEIVQEWVFLSNCDISGVAYLLLGREKHNWGQFITKRLLSFSLTKIIKWDAQFSFILQKGWTKQSKKKRFKTERSHRTN